MPEYVMIVPDRMKNGIASMGKDSAPDIMRCTTISAGIPVGYNTKYASAETIRQNATGIFSRKSTRSRISGKTTHLNVPSFHRPPDSSTP